MEGGRDDDLSLQSTSERLLDERACKRTSTRFFWKTESGPSLSSVTCSITSVHSHIHNAARPTDNVFMAERL